MSTPEYKKETYDRIGLVVRKGKRAEYQQAAEDFGISLSELIKVATETFIAERSLSDLPVKPPPLKSQTTESITPEQRRLLESINRLPTEAQKSLMKFLKAVNEKGGGDNGEARE